MLNMMFVDDMLIEVAETMNVDIEEVVDFFNDLADDLGREPFKYELERYIERRAA